MENNQNDSALHFFRIKTEWTAEQPNGMLSKIKTEELVMAVNYSDAERVAYSIAEDQERSRYGSINIEITKTKISDVIYNDVLQSEDFDGDRMVCNYFEEGDESGVGLYAVKLFYITINEKTGKEIRTADTLYVPATSNADSIHRVDEYLKSSMADYVIRDTKFDRAEAIYWPNDIHKSKLSSK